MFDLRISYTNSEKHSKAIDSFSPLYPERYKPDALLSVLVESINGELEKFDL